MRFDNLKDKCEYFRSLTDYKLVPNGYAIAMLDGRSFSKLIKNKYEKPFDQKFMTMMDETAKYLLKNIQGAKFAYVQSDEISILITDFDTPMTDSVFGYRLCKMQSLFASMAASKFNQLELYNEIKTRSYDARLYDSEDTLYSVNDCMEVIEDKKLVEFDCKVWNVPDYNTAFCHFLWRQNDCTRNSKQQAAQTYLPHKELLGLEADEQIEKLEGEKGICWGDYTFGKRYGRIIYKEEKTLKNNDGTEYTRNQWTVHDAMPFGDDDNVIKTLIPKRNE